MDLVRIQREKKSLKEEIKDLKKELAEVEQKIEDRKKCLRQLHWNPELYFEETEKLL